MLGTPFGGYTLVSGLPSNNFQGKSSNRSFTLKKAWCLPWVHVAGFHKKRIAGIWFGPRSLHVWPEVAVVLRCKNHLKLNGYCYRKGTLAKFRRISFSVITTRITFKANRYTTSTFHHWIVAHPGAFSGIDRSGFGEKLIDSNGTFKNNWLDFV